MSRVAPFESHTDRYERWFEQHQAAYCSEMLAVRAQMPLQGLGVEIGVGSGRFAAPLGVAIGVDPSFNVDPEHVPCVELRHLALPHGGHQALQGDDIVPRAHVYPGCIDEGVLSQHQAHSITDLVVVVLFGWLDAETVDYVATAGHPPCEHPGEAARVGATADDAMKFFVPRAQDCSW